MSVIPLKKDYAFVGFAEKPSKLLMYAVRGPLEVGYVISIRQLSVIRFKVQASPASI